MCGSRLVMVAVLVMACSVPAAQACPRSCNCYQANEVHCTFRSLLSVPQGLPAHTQRINLGFNSITRIPENSLAGLKRAELLMLHSNDLNQIPDGVFGDMRSLQVLKLSYNKLEEISSSAFSGLTSLLRLHLDHNHLRHLHPRALLQLPSLRLLRLQGNRLHQLHPRSLCTLSLLNTYYYSTLRHLDLSNNSLASLPEPALSMAPLLDTLVLYSNPWRCDCAMAWFLGWSRAHPGLMKCPGGPQCPVCDTPVYLQGRGLLRQTDLQCTSPSIFSSGRDPPSAGDPGEMKELESFREPLGNASLGLSDHQGNSVDLSCNVTHTLHSPDIPPPDLSLPSAAPIPMALSLSLECAVERAGYESLWRILAYYSETAVRLEREIMLSKPPALAYRYRQTAETEGYYYTGVKASLKTTPHWMLQPAVSLQLNRAQSSERKVQLILTTRVSVHPDPIYRSSSSSSLAVADPLSRHPWAMILSSTAPSAYAAVAGSRVEMSCPLVSSGNFTVHWILPDGSKLVSPYRSTDDRVSVSDSGILLHRTESSDAGLYYCVAQAGSDVDVLPLRLAVEESSIAATGEQIGPSVTGQVGEFVTLLCNASGSPTPHIRWLLPDGSTVRYGTTVPGGASVQSNGSLSLAQASLKDDGSYRCMAVNQYGADSLSMRLDISAQAGPFRSSFHRGPQSASGRSTRIRAPLLRDTVVEDGSGDNSEEENPKVPVINRRRPQYPLNRRLPSGHPRRRGPIRGGKPLREGGPPSQSQPGRNRFDSRQRVSATKQRIDPKKWADLLAKIRQRTTLNSTTPPTEVEELSLEPVDKETNTLTSRVDGEGTTGSKREEVSSDIDRVLGEGGNNRDRQQGEVETEGSAFEDVSLQEEGLQPIDHIITQTLTNTEIRTNLLANTETESGTERNALSETQASNDRENKADTQTQSISKTEAPTAQVTSKQISITNEIDLEKPDPSPTRFQNNHHRVNPVPNTRPESPLDTRRRTSQRRRPFTRFRVRPKTPPRPLPDPNSPGSQAVTLDTRSNQMSSSAPPTPFAVKETHGLDRIGSDSSLSNSLDVDPPSPTLFDSLSLSLSASPSPSYSPPRSPPPQTEEEEVWEEADEERGSPTGKPSDTLTLSTALPDLMQYDRLPPPLAPDISLAGEIQTDVQAQGQPPSGTHTDGVVPQHAEEMEEDQPFPSTFPSRVTSSPPPQYVVPSTTKITTAATTTSAKMTRITSTTSVTSIPAAVSESTLSAISSIKQGAPIHWANSPTSTTTSTTTTARTTTSPVTEDTTAVFIPLRTASVTSKTTAVVTAASTTPFTTVTVQTPASSTTFTMPNHSSIPQTSISPGTREHSRERPGPGLVVPRERPSQGPVDPSERQSPGLVDPRERPSPGLVDPRERPSPGLVDPRERQSPGLVDPRERTSPGLVDPRERTSPGLVDPREGPSPGLADPRERPSPGLVDPVERPSPGLADPRERPSPGLVDPVERPSPGLVDPRERQSPGLVGPREGLSPGVVDPRERPSPELVDPRERPSQGLVDPRERPSTGLVDLRERPVPSHIRPGPDWKSPSVNSIPDSHSTRPILPASPILPGSPVLPKVPVERSKPRISDPHSRSASVPAGSVARLDCEAQGEPAPTVTWTKVSTGAVMSAQARAQRFQVLPNGTFVIHDVGLQDRGTYMCSAHSFLGRDRMLTTLEVWSRPPRMKLANYREATIHQGGDLSLDCQADAVPAPLLSWVLPDRSALTANSTHPRMTLHPNGTLHLREAAAQDRGVYRCVASNLAGVASGSVRLHVSSLPPAILQPREELLVLGRGTPLYAHCSARGAPPPTLRWRTPDGTRVRPSQFLHGNLFVLPNGTLHVRRLGPADVGGYECTASNAVGVARRTVSVRLRGDAAPSLPPEAPRDRGQTSLLLPPLSPPSSDRGPPTSPQPPPKINSAAAALPPTSSLDAGRSQPSSSQLSEPPLPPSHRRGSLPLGKTEAVPSFSAGDRSRDSPAPTHSSAPVSPLRKAHIVDTSPSATAVHYGGYLQLHCSVSGNPTPSIIWRTPARKLVDEHFSSDRRMKVHPNGTLLVLVVTEKDAGDYLCIARNKVADDYRLLRVTVSTKPAKIDPKQSANKMVPFGGSLKVDCLASGQPDPAVSWSLPDGTMVNSVLQGEEPGPGRPHGEPLRLTVFGNGTLLVPVMGVTEEGEYTCYAKNNGGQDTMKVKVQVMRDSAPSFSDAPGRHVTRVRPGATAVLRCRVKGDPVPTVTWFSPNHRVIPRSLGSRSFSERVVVVSDGTLEVRTAQRGDAGNYTCRARNAAGERSRMVGLELEELYYTPNTRGTPNVLGTPNGRGTPWQGSSDVNPAGGTGSSRPHGDIHQYAPTHGAASRLASSGGVSSQSNSRVFSSPPTSDIQLANTGSKPPSPSGDSVGVQDRGSTAGLGHRLNTVGGNNNIAIRQGIAGTQRNQGAVTVNSGLAAVGGSDGWAARSSHNEVASGRLVNKTGLLPAHTGSQPAHTGSQPAYTGWLRGGATSFSSRSHATSGGTSSPSHATHTVSGVSSVQHRAGRGQTVLLPCPSHGSPPPRLYWLLPGNGVLPAPYYGSRLTVHRNGSLELRGLRPSDAGKLVCVVQGGGGETRVQVELSVSDPGGPGGELTLQREPAVVLSVSPHSGDLPRVSPGSVRSLHPTPLLPKALRPGGPVWGTSPQGGLFLPSLPRPAAPVLVPAAPVADRQTPVVSIRTASLVSIINGEDLRLSCHAVPGAGGLQGSFSWTLPRGEVLSQGQSTGSGRYMVLPDGTLHVQQATVFDRGSYTCRSTPNGSATAAAVTTPVIVIAYPPRVIKGPQPVTYTRFGVAIELPCLTIATPRAALTWETPDLTQLRVTGQARIYGNRFLSAQGSLVIQNPTSRDTGFYRCTAKNVMGADSKATYLHVV
ncbi:matrix-remodeling-associated protein 5-like isoform X2 [Gadus macrocephalus]|uniref:matrix-remodeling-associated protein 5-like isoform X2 n=1 Tax=Gadus macrocephalus TaxID=80720 RepID=UPI0028CB99A9|nr:matrix-remodeling-associated protein 5-like isoform X2 [Gadus macrocephalus]